MVESRAPDYELGSRSITISQMLLSIARPLVACAVPLFGCYALFFFSPFPPLIKRVAIAVYDVCWAV